MILQIHRLPALLLALIVFLYSCDDSETICIDCFDADADTDTSHREDSDIDEDTETDTDIYVPLTDSFSIYFIDVGQGDATLIRTNAGSFVLIDSGPRRANDALTNFLNELEVDSLHRIILSHPDCDHYCEFVDFIDYYCSTSSPPCESIGGFVYSGMASESSRYSSLLGRIVEEEIPLEVAYDDPGFSFVLDNLTFTFYHPPSSRYTPDDSTNNNSIVAIICNESDTCFLSGGDLEYEGIDSLLERHRDDIDVDILKVNHHGAANGTTEEFLDATSPSFAFICVGASNPYGHPSRSTLNMLWEDHVYIYRTDYEGNIAVNVVEEDIRVTTGYFGSDG
jgi:competence protein ComEC